MSSTQGHTNINTTYTTIDISPILSEINRIADETYLRGVEEGHRIANIERAELLDKVAEKIREHSGLHYVDCDGYFGGIAELIFKVDDWLDEVINEMKAEVQNEKS